MSWNLFIRNFKRRLVFNFLNDQQYYCLQTSVSHIFMEKPLEQIYIIVSRIKVGGEYIALLYYINLYYNTI